MRILALAGWWPEPADNGIKMRIAQLLGALAQRHEVHLLALCHEAPPQAQPVGPVEACASADMIWLPRRQISLAARIGSLWRAEPASLRSNWSVLFASAVRERAAAIRPDLVVAFELATAPYARLLLGVPKLLDDLETTRMREQYAIEPDTRLRLRAWISWQKHAHYVRSLLSDFDTCTVVSPAELADARRVAPEGLPLSVLPNGADVAGAEKDWSTPTPDTLIYPGSLSFDANREAMAYFLGALFPAIKAARPQAQLTITGRATAAERAALPPSDGVVFSGYVPDVRPLIARSWAEIVPLRIGSGTRLKVLEALALGTPVITTAKGAEGLDLEHGRHMLIADGDEAFVAATTRLLADPGLRDYLASEGRRAVRERYDWRVIGAQFCALAEAVAAQQVTCRARERAVGIASGR